MNHINPVLFGLIGGILTYLILYLDNRFENKKFSNRKNSLDAKCKCPSLYITLKVPLIIGVLTWVIATYFEDNNSTILNTNDIEETIVSEFDQDIFTDVPDF